MPEGSDVKQNMDEIRKELKGFVLTGLNILDGKYSRQITLKNCRAFKKSLPSKCIEINSKGKFAYMILENGWSIWFAFGMTGFLTTDKDLKHNNIEFIVKSPKSNFYFNDQRNYGTIKLEPNIEDLNEKLETLGPDPLNSRKNSRYFIEKIRSMNPNKEISIVLLDQGLLSGVGNYVRAEALYRANISPFIKLKNMSDDILKKLLNAIYFIMKKVYNERPRTKNSSHQPFQFQVYERKIDNKGNPVIWKKQPDVGRTIYYIKNQGGGGHRGVPI